MKKFLGKLFFVIVIVAGLGLIGRMDYEDQRIEDANSKELFVSWSQSNDSPSPLDSVCLASNSHMQHCKTQHE